MSKKKKKNKETTIENYYDLKVDKVDDLVAALKGDQSEEQEEISMKISDCSGDKADGGKTSDKEFNPYKLDRLSRIPTWVKAIFIKFWSNGLVCFLFVWGLQGLITDHLDLMVLTGIMLGIINDLFVNTAFMHFQSDEREYDNYMMFPFPFKKFWTFFTNIAYYTGVVFAVYFGFYFWINKLTTFGLEPITFGLLCVAFDMAFIGLKDLVVYLVKKRKRKKEEEADV